ncbi:MAG: CocE/NonD family hydrolase [Acidobacteriota bacterium]
MSRLRVFLVLLPLSAFYLVAHAWAQPEQASASAAQLSALSGEYTYAADPGTPLSFYVQNGVLTVESSRMAPRQLNAVSVNEFVVPEMGRLRFDFTRDGAGRGATVFLASDPGVVYHRTGSAVHHVFHDYVASDVMIPMRDGVKLHAIVLRPVDIHTPLPFLMQRTPYGVNGTSRASFFAQNPELARDGYIYVAEDIRGRYGSQGKFVMMRPLADHSNPNAVDESTDTYDTIAWLLKNVPGNNGRVGVLGISYPGFLATMAGIDPHPALKAISPQAPMIDVWRGDDFFHNGAFRQSYGYDYVLDMESSKKFTSDGYGKTPDGQPEDGYDFFLKRGSFQQDVKQSGSKLLPTWKLFLNHPAYDQVWRSRGVEYHLNTVAVPTLTVGGYYDQEDMWGPQEEYKKLEPHDRDHQNFLVEGPWRHGYWISSSNHLGNLQYGQPIGSEFRRQIQARFFAHYLKGAPGFALQNTASFQTGSDTWKYYKQFPPADAHTISLYLEAHHALAWNRSAAPAKFSYISDPAHPVPYRHRPIQPTYGPGSQWYDWMTEDQRFVTDRKDVAVWTLPVLQHDLTLTGEVVADIYAATTGSDNDMVVKLIDQYPDNDPDPKMRGYQLMTNMEIFRGRYLSGFDKPMALAPNSIHEYKYSLHDVDHVFKAGHTVMVEIQSTWFPLYDRNPQTFVPNIMKARPSAYKAETITIYSGAGHDSRLLLPVVSR